MTNIFNFVPHVLLQYEINPYLTGIDRANWNAVLEPTERVHKKLPADFAIKHALYVAYNAQKRHANIINSLTERANTERLPKNGIMSISRYALFFLKPVATPLFQYRDVDSGKARAIHELNDFISDDSVYAPFMTEKIRTQITIAIEIIQSITVERHFNI